MSDTVLTCPNCGHEIPLTEALTAQLRGELEVALRVEHEARLKQAMTDAEARARLQAEQAAARAREAAAKDLGFIQDQLAEQQRKTREAQAAELALRKEKTALEERARELDLEIARRVDAEKKRLEESVRKSAAEEQALKLREKDKQIDDLKKLVDEMKRKSEQGSQELQGEALELDIQAALERRFPRDEIRPIPKGASGADLVQEVRNDQGALCGRIVWETKNTRHWQHAWPAKLRDDTRATQGNVAVLVSVALPPAVHEFGLLEGIWVASPCAWPTLAVALREQLIQVAFAHAAGEGKNEKMELLYRYLAGDQFRAKVQGIVEAFTALQNELQRERRAMERIWKEREKQIERVILNTVGMYGEMRGIVGSSLPEIPVLTLEGAAGSLEGEPV
jgi:hypothetical protein